ncbi:hypothetical protein B0H17DRAFT_1200381 [Mycena rosella]|uniref:Uncharacterized protein n=1 Tax=Mycena rosella TaxID=1033263 RepID=A0AAD7DKV3_MYCRO|nr:hypothetical protein B0H17DRAFT_1200381 [Mycena rosella]
MRTGEDADYFYEPSGFSLDAHPDFTYPPPSHPSLHFSQARLGRVTDDENRDPVDNSTGAADKAEQSGSEEVAPSKRGKKTGPCNAFGGTQLIQLARAIDKCKPYLASHGGVGEAWKATNRHLKATGFALDVKYMVLQNKAKALIAYKKDPTCEEAKFAAPHMKDDVAILIASALEKFEQQ